MPVPLIEPEKETFPNRIRNKNLKRYSIERGT